MWLKQDTVIPNSYICGAASPLIGSYTYACASEFYLADQLEAKCYPSELYNYSGHNAVYTVSLRSNKPLELQMFSIAQQNAALKITV